ncbi:Uncharacterised protein [Providencia stuartii]|nr:Uncharacterised protein [Providencia stuartii]
MAEDTVDSTSSAVPPSYGELFLGDKSPLALHDAHLSGQHNAPAPPLCPIFAYPATLVLSFYSVAYCH